MASKGPLGARAHVVNHLAKPTRAIHVGVPGCQTEIVLNALPPSQYGDILWRSHQDPDLWETTGAAQGSLAAWLACPVVPGAAMECANGAGPEA